MNNKGFVLAWLSILLVFIIGITSAVSSLLIIQWNKQKQTEYCRNEMKNIQRYAAQQARALITLNPQSLQLRAELLLVEKQILVALAAGQIPVVKFLKLKRVAIRFRQKKLDLTQKLIVNTTHTTLKIKIQSLRQNIKNQLDDNNRNLGNWGKSYSLMAPAPASRFAFKPSDAALAPTYEPYKQFERSQSMAISWVEKYQWSSWQRAFSFPSQIRSQCRLTLKEKSWLPIIQKDRL